MRSWTFFFAGIFALSFFSCSKHSSAGDPATGLVGTWVLSKSCVCNTCTDSNSFNHQTLIFRSGGQVDLYGSVGDAEGHASGTYAVTQHPDGNILNITLNAGTPDFLFIPGAVIYVETRTTLILNLNTPFGNPCLYQNTYALAHN